MRFVIRPAGTCPAHLQPAVVAAALNQIVQANDRGLVEGAVYRAPYRNAHGEPCSATLDALRPFYHAKCAYCEALTNLEVEHYRPVGAQRGHHGGYLWLCYEWTNLLPACHDCNSFAGGKGAQFPVLGSRQRTAPLLAGGGVDSTRNALTSLYLTGENPQLLHPELDDPTSFLTVLPAPGRDGFELQGTDAAHRGRESIRLCHLNREPLRLERLALLQDMKADIGVVFQSLSEGLFGDAGLPRALKVTFKKWEQTAAEEARTHTFVRRCVTGTVTMFHNLLLPLLPTNQAALVEQAFVKYKAGHL
jgi:hypothetical protein